MTSEKSLDTEEQNVTKKTLKCYYKTRPITATLEHPLILDIKLLKKLDMTTFTKKGLIALSKFCGISLITKTEAKKKFNKCVKLNGSKQCTNDVSDEGTTKSQVKNLNKKELKAKRKQRKQILKPGSRIRFKTTEENVSVDEDSADVVCKMHNKVLMTNNRLTKSPGDIKLTDRKLIINDMINTRIENIIPEPCKTCCRSELPERFHSHPKTLAKLNLGQKTSNKNLEVVIKCTSTTKKSEKETKQKKMEKTTEASQKTSSQESLSPNEEPDTSTISSPELQVKNSTLIKGSSPESDSKLQSKSDIKLQSEVKLSNEKKNVKKTNVKIIQSLKEENRVHSDDVLKYLTGCYLCGKQVSPKMRMKHEESCILEWRTQNSLLSPDKRKPEPRRPDFRFTVSGDLDCEGTFESIWANHKESLVPCKKCGRTFFPDRIEKHENCCNNAPINKKYKH